MAITLNCTIAAGVEWSQESVTSVTTLTDAGSYLLDGELQDGTEHLQANLIWHDTRTLDSGGNETLDLFDLTRNIFNDSYQISFSGGVVRAFTITNLSAGSIQLNFDSGIVSNPFNSMVDNITGVSTIYPYSARVFSNLWDGWTVGTTQRNVYVDDIGGSGSTYEIVIVGATG